MNLSRDDLLQVSADTGFPAAALEKAIRLVGLLNALWSHTYLKSRIALKGGTALNLFVLDLPRLSVDIDLNYIGSIDREAMLEDRPKIEQAIEAVCGREDLTVRRKPDEHAGGKWLLRYTAVSGQGGNLELDLNFQFREPLWPVVRRDSRRLGTYQATDIAVLDLHELSAGKIVALCDRGVSRDLFDAHQLLRRDELDAKRLRLGFVVYGGASRKDWRTVTVENVRCDPAELRGQLLPTLRTVDAEALADVAAWAEHHVAEVRSLMSAVLPFRENEIEFLDQLNDRGKIAPELLTNDEQTRTIIHRHPALNWKAMNVRKHYGL